MDELFGENDCRLRVSISDSTMMWLVHFAMEKAHEKVKSNEGIIRRLHEISRFYELAVLQLEGCMRFVQEEAGSFESSREEEVLADLAEIRNRLQGRLKEAQKAISGKDREFTERLENEMKLRLALEVKERELDSLRADLQLERTKSEEDRDGEFCELKNSVDKQVLNIRQRLGPDHELDDEESDQGIDNKKIEQMGFDIDILKGTLDFAFAKMQSAIILSEVEPIEQQWRWAIEKDTMTVSIKGFMRKVSLAFNNHLSELMKEVTSLRDEIEPLTDQNEVQKDEHVPEGDGKGKANDSSLKIKLVDSMHGHPGEDQEEDGSHSVAKMIKNHEFIIRRKSEELNWLKGDMLNEKGPSTNKRDKDPDGLKRRIQQIIAKLDDLIDWNAKMRETFNEYRCVHKEGASSEKGLFKFDITDEEEKSVSTLADAWEKVDKMSVFPTENGKLQNEIGLLKQEKEDRFLQTMIMEDTCVTVFRCLMSECYFELHNCELESLIREGICKDFFRETVNDWNENFEGNKIEGQIREEIFYVVFHEASEEFCRTQNFTLAETFDSRDENNSLEHSTQRKMLDNLEGAIRDDIWTVLFREILRGWEDCIESYNTDGLVREDIYQIILDETVKNIVDTANSAISQYRDQVEVADKNLYDISTSMELFQNSESLREDICMVYFKERIKEWRMNIDDYNMESLIREEIYQFLIVEATKDAAYIFFTRSEVVNQDSISEEPLSANRLCDNDQEDSGEGNLTKKFDTILRCLEVEEDFMLSASSEIKVQNVQLELEDTENEEYEKEIFEELLAEEEDTFSSVGIKMDMALEQLGMSKTLVNELGSSLGVAVYDVEKDNNQMAPIVDIIHDREASLCNPQDNEEKLSDSVLSSLQGVSEVLKNFECTVDQRLGMNVLRLEEVKFYLDSLVEHITTLRKRELVYRKAFIRRCQNLQKAEIEVDLLGDQVEALFGLLEQIYMALHNYSPVLEPHFEVSSILRMIKRELIREITALPDSPGPAPDGSTLPPENAPASEPSAPKLPPSPPLPPPLSPPPLPLPPSLSPEPRGGQPPPDGQTPNAKDVPSGLSGGQKAGIVIGVLAGAGVLGFVAFVYKKRLANIRRRRYGYAARRSFL